MNSNNRAKLASVVVAQKGQAIPSSNGPLAGGRVLLAFAPNEQEQTRPQSQDVSPALEPVTGLTSEVVQRGRTRSEERSELVEVEDAIAESNDLIDIEASGEPPNEEDPKDNLPSDDGKVEGAVAESVPGNNFQKNAMVIILISSIAVAMLWVAFFA